MIPIPLQCLKRHQKPLFSLEEDGCRLSFENPERFNVEEIKIDKCVIADEDSKRCDYLLHIEESDCSILIELKGGKIEEGITQLQATYPKFKSTMRSRHIWILCHSGSMNIPEVRRGIIQRQAAKQGAELAFHRSQRPFIIK